MWDNLGLGHGPFCLLVAGQRGGRRHPPQTLAATSSLPSSPHLWPPPPLSPTPLATSPDLPRLHAAGPPLLLAKKVFPTAGVEEEEGDRSPGGRLAKKKKKRKGKKGERKGKKGERKGKRDRVVFIVFFSGSPRVTPVLRSLSCRLLYFTQCRY